MKTIEIGIVWFIIIILLALNIGLQIGKYVESKRVIKPSLYSGIDYRKMADSLECVLIRMEIEKRNRNDIFTYSLKKHKP